MKMETTWVFTIKIGYIMGRSWSTRWICQWRFCSLVKMEFSTRTWEWLTTSTLLMSMAWNLRMNSLRTCKTWTPLSACASKKLMSVYMLWGIRKEHTWSTHLALRCIFKFVVITSIFFLPKFLTFKVGLCLQQKSCYSLGCGSYDYTWWSCNWKQLCKIHIFLQLCASPVFSWCPAILPLPCALGEAL